MRKAARIVVYAANSKVKTKLDQIWEIVIRELVANALIHQDFNQSGTSVMIEIYTNRVEISNPSEPLVGESTGGEGKSSSRSAVNLSKTSRQDKEAREDRQTRGFHHVLATHRFPCLAPCSSRRRQRTGTGLTS